MTIEEEIRARLVSMGISEQGVGPCMEHIKADPITRSLAKYWADETDCCGPDFMVTVWTVSKSAAMDWLVLQITAPLSEDKKSPVTLSVDGAERKDSQ